jgi:ATP/ADP translocase
MIQLGGTMIHQAWDVIAFVCVIITTLGGAGAIIVSIIKWWRQPDKTRDEMLKEHEKKLDNDHKRLMELEESNKIMMQSMLALMSHAIDGNHIEDLRQARDDLQKYLIRR